MLALLRSDRVHRRRNKGPNRVLRHRRCTMVQGESLPSSQMRGRWRIRSIPCRAALDHQVHKPAQLASTPVDTEGPQAPPILLPWEVRSHPCQWLTTPAAALGQHLPSICGRGRLEVAPLPTRHRPPKPGIRPPGLALVLRDRPSIVRRLWVYDHNYPVRPSLITPASHQMRPPRKPLHPRLAGGLWSTLRCCQELLMHSGNG